MLKMSRLVSFFLLVVFAFLASFSFISCKHENLNEERIKKVIIGKWKKKTINGAWIPTNQESVWTFYSDGTATVSFSSVDGIWDEKEFGDYVVAENAVTVKKKSDGDVITRTVSEISNNKLTFSNTISFLHPELCSELQCTFEKIRSDYSQKIVGLWQGVSSEGDETYGDYNHRWEYFADGTYIYYELVNGHWVASDNTYNVYVVDGDWLATRWMDKEGHDYREWWDIESCDDSKMTWKAIRERADGTYYVARFEMKRVKNG